LIDDKTDKKILNAGILCKERKMGIF